MSIRQGQTIVAKMGMSGGSSSYKGEYSDTIVYNKGDYVYYENRYYICKQDNVINILPIVSNQWNSIDNDYNVQFEEVNTDAQYQLGLIDDVVFGMAYRGRVKLSKNAPKVNASTGEIIGYAKTEDLPTKVSELENDSGYLTEHQDLTDYALKSELPIVPTNVSAFTNDSGYLTSHQDISGKADKSNTYTKSEVDALLIPVISKTANGYCKFSNGLIIQWGQIAGNVNTRHTVTLPTPFTSTNYTVCSSNTTYADSAPWGATIEETTTTTFKILQVHKQKIWWMAIGY